MMSSCQDIIYESCKHTLTVSESEFLDSISSWEFIPIGDGASVMVKDNEIHSGCLPEFKGKWLTRRHIRSVFGSLLKQYGWVKTRVMNDNEEAHSFVSRLGFKKTHTDCLCTYYILSQVPYGKPD